MHTWPVEIRRGIVRQDHAEVEIAVRTAITAGGGAEQIDTLRVVVVHQTTGNLRDGLVLGHPPILCIRDLPIEIPLRGADLPHSLDEFIEIVVSDAPVL